MTTTIATAATGTGTKGSGLLKAAMLAGILVAASAAPGLAVPASPLPAAEQDAALTLVRHGGPHKVRRPHRFRPVPHRRYGSPPRGWHRYHARPHDWRTRGCLMFGPLWFCP